MVLAATSTHCHSLLGGGALKMVVPMAANDGSDPRYTAQGWRVTELAREVISTVGAETLSGREQRVAQAAQVLRDAVTDRAPFDGPAVRQRVDALELTRAELLDYCVPAVAYGLGEDWLRDDLSFVSVSTASARLFGLCKDVSAGWDLSPRRPDAASFLFATLGREDHIVGPAIATQQIRRAGHSVRMAFNSGTSEILDLMHAADHEAVFISAASFQTLDIAVETIRKLKGAGLKSPIILGGAILDYEPDLKQQTDADLVTKDVQKALALALARATTKVGAA